MTRILIAEDHAIVRKGLKQLLTENFPNVIFHESTTILETLKSLQEGRWDLLLLGLFMPDGNGFDILKETGENHPGLPVLIFSSASEEELGVRALRAGASGFLNKQAAPARIVQAIHKVLAGDKYVSPALMQQLAATTGCGNQPLHEKLSDREFQILHLVIAGRSLKKEIAGDLSLSVKTIRTFHARLLGKLQIQSDVDLVHYALNHGLAEKRMSPSISLN